MKTFNKGNWVDRAIGLAGILIAFFPGLDLIGVFKNINSSKVISVCALLVGLAILLFVFFKSRRKDGFQKIGIDELYNYIHNNYQHYDKIIISNPKYTSPRLNETIRLLNNNKKEIVIAGDASCLSCIYEQFAQDVEIMNKINVLSLSQEVMGIFLFEKNFNSAVISLINNSYANVLTIKNKDVAEELYNMIDKEHNTVQTPIKLEGISHPAKFLSVIEREKSRYIDNFKDLKSGYISFSGTEVLNVQSGWVESGAYKVIRTLDITSDPSILLTRHRYNKANKDFIARGGIIQRVYLISKEKLIDSFFYDNFKHLIAQQLDIGVAIGFQYIDELSVEQKQDFILYDSSIVLLEEKQANSDYTFGRSTAYFSKDKIKTYEDIFRTVWAGRRLKIDELS